MINALFIHRTAKHYDAMSALGASGLIDLQKLLTWVGEYKFNIQFVF